MSFVWPVYCYRCLDFYDCGWEGVIPEYEIIAARTGRPARAGMGSGPRRVALLVAALVTFALGGFLLRQHFAPDPALRYLALEESALPLPVGLGEHYDGELVPIDHPASVRLLKRVAANAAELAAVNDASAPEGAQSGQEPVAPEPPLTLRRGCAWGQPGRDPYKGSVAQALNAANLPPEVVRKAEQMIARKLVTDRVEISNQGIRGIDSGLKFSARSIGMTYGTTYCYDTQVNFTPGHVEKADLYRVSDAAGATYSIMVPYVCGNVSVLEARAEDGTVVAGINGQVPEPQTWTLLVAGLGMVAWFVARRRRERELGND